MFIGESDNKKSDSGKLLKMQQQQIKVIVLQFLKKMYLSVRFYAIRGC